jgi:hypothetical protein
MKVLWFHVTCGTTYLHEMLALVSRPSAPVGGINMTRSPGSPASASGRAPNASSGMPPEPRDQGADRRQRPCIERLRRILHAYRPSPYSDGAWSFEMTDDYEAN